jgi:hypothetical protein
MSNVQPDIVLAKSINVYETHDERTDISDEDELIQISVRNLQTGFSVDPHSHLIRKPEKLDANEVWLVLSGQVEARIFDVDDTPVISLHLNVGDLIAFYTGGHSLQVLKSHTKFIEFKSGPYLGVVNDKRSF